MSLMELIQCYDGLTKLGFIDDAKELKIVIQRFVAEIKKTQTVGLKAKKNEKKEE